LSKDLDKILIQQLNNRNKPFYKHLKLIVMKRKDFLLKGGLGFIGMSTIIDACKKEAAENTIGSLATSTNEAATGCIVTPTEMEGPFPYPGGELKNPLNRSDVREDQKGVLLKLTFKVVNVNNSCAVVPGARVDIWQCNKDGYYSGYADTGFLGKKDYTGKTWLRGFQRTDSNGAVHFSTIYPGWYRNRATHIHFEVYINRVLKKTGQIAFPETINNEIYATALYKAHGPNPTKNKADNVFGNSLTDLSHETAEIIKKSFLNANYTIGLAL
jgi:protocatechuate 3,4-dioxygenase beta subunit